MIKQQEHQQLWELIETIPVAMLTTRDEGAMRSRPMHLIQSEYHGRLWFFTNLKSHKTEEIGEYPQVNLAFMDTEQNRYISVTGSATVTQDSKLIDTFWSAPASVWFPEGKDSKEVAMIEIDVESAEVWDIQTGKVTQLIRIAKAKMNNEVPDIGMHKKFG